MCALTNKLKSIHLEQFQKLLPSSGSILSQANGDDLSFYLSDWTGKFRAEGGNEFLVLRPNDSRQVSEILKFCNEQRIGVVPQGGNTGLVGGAVPYSKGHQFHSSVILSMSRMNRIHSIDKTSGVVKVEAGCILEEVDKKCREEANLMVPIDLGAKGSCQMGGILATNAGGIRFLRYGSLHGNCLGLEVVLADGRITSDMRGLRKDSTGYDLKQLFIGSEGTLGVITAAAIQAVPEPKSVNVACFQLDSFNKVQQVFRAARESLGEILSAYEFWDESCEEILQAEHHGKMFEESGGFYVLIETSGSDMAHDQEKLNRFLETVMSDGIVKDGIVAQDQKQQEEIWGRREGIPEACSKQKGQVHKYDLSFPAAFYYDLVPILRTKTAVKEGRIKVFGFGHVGDGNIHINLVAENGSKEIGEISQFIFDWTAANGGSVSAEHGIGQAKRDQLSKSKGPVEIELMKSLKNLFDPNMILNPGGIAPIMDLVNRIVEWKKNLNLPSAGSYENLHREARNVSLTNLLFEGGKADLAKGLSANFQVAHSFTLGTGMQPSSYHFASIFASGKHLCHGMIDTAGNFQGKYHYTITDGLTAKLQTMISNQPGQSMVQLEGDWVGAGGTSINVKAINPNPTDGNGIFTCALLQSLSKSLAVGGEVIAQKVPDSPAIEQGINLGMRFKVKEDSTFTATLQQFVALQTSYHHRVSEKVELATEMQMLLVGPRKDAVTSVGAKFEYRQATLRAQLDSTGRVGMVLEEKLFPGFALLLSGEIDHVRSVSRFGVGITMEN